VLKLADRLALLLDLTESETLELVLALIGKLTLLVELTE